MQTLKGVLDNLTDLAEGLRALVLAEFVPQHLEAVPVTDLHHLLKLLVDDFGYCFLAIKKWVAGTMLTWPLRCGRDLARWWVHQDPTLHEQLAEHDFELAQLRS